MNQPTTPNTVEDFPPLPKPKFWSKDHPFEDLFTADQVRAAILADRAQRTDAPSGEAVAWAVVAPKGGIHKLAITKESADRKMATWLLEWPNNKCSVRPLVFGDATTPSEIEAVELPLVPAPFMHAMHTRSALISYATEAVLKDRANRKDSK